MHFSELISLAESAHHSSELDRAEALYARALAQNPGSAHALYGLGTVKMQLEHFDQATELLRQAASVEPDAVDIAFNLALCREKVGDISEAGRIARAASALVAGDEPLATAYAELLLRLGLPSDALEVLTAKPVSTVAARRMLARACAAVGAWDQAVSVLRSLQAQVPEDPKVAESLSLAAGHLRDWPLAISSYKRHLSLAGATAERWIRFADLLLMARMRGESMQALDHAEQLGADSAAYHALRARLARLAGKDQAALQHARQAIQRDPANAMSWSLCSELAPENELPILRRNLRGAMLSIRSPQERVLAEFAEAQAAEREGDYPSAASAIRRGNAAQHEHLRSLGKAYDQLSEKERREKILNDYQQAPGHDLGDDTQQPIFIVGMPRSGTTLLERILGQLDGVEVGGENEALAFVASAYARDRHHHRLLPSPAELSRKHWQSMARKYRELSGVSGAVSTNKLPHNFLHVGLILGMFPRARILQMRRRREDTCLSIYALPFPDDHAYACHAPDLVHAWNGAQRLMDHWVTLAPEQVRDVIYEEFVAEPEIASRELAEFCGLTWRPACLDYRGEGSASYTFSERQVRGPIEISTRERPRLFRPLLPELFDILEPG